MKSSDCNVAKRQKINDTKQSASPTSCIELVLFNSDSLFKIASYLSATDLLNLALTCRRYGMAAESDDDISLIEDITRQIVQDITITTGEERPKIDGESWLANYHYLRSIVIFDQFNANFEYVEGKSCIRSTIAVCASAITNNIMKAGKHYVSFDASDHFFLVGVMRPGTFIDRTKSRNPVQSGFFEIFSQSTESLVYNTNNSIHCCMYYSYDDSCHSRDWNQTVDDGSTRDDTWRESFTRGGDVGLLLDLDEGTLSVCKNGQSVGVMKRGLFGHYCWVASILRGAQITIKREKIPKSLR